MKNFTTYRDAMRFIHNAGLLVKPVKRRVWLGQFGETMVWSVAIG
jgi:hypothetical protein